MTEQGTGYFQQNFSISCQLPKCQFEITKERLAVLKVVQDIIRADGTYLAYVLCGTHPDVLVDISAPFEEEPSVVQTLASIWDVAGWSKRA